MIKEFSLKKNGEEQLSKNFQVKEFACNDNTDKILIDTVLVDILQKYRDAINKPIIIDSGYRTEAYNKKVGGKDHSYHLSGQAVQIRVNGVKPEEIAHWFYVNEPKANGIGIITSNGVVSVHIDTRNGVRYCFVQHDDKVEEVGKF